MICWILSLLYGEFDVNYFNYFPVVELYFLLVGGATGGGFETLRGDKTNCFITNPKLTN